MPPAADLGHPCPADPLWFRLDCKLHIRCQHCRRHARVVTVRSFALRHQVDTRLRFFEIVPRLGCSACGARDAAIDVQRPGF